jgi:hypothetical protein
MFLQLPESEIIDLIVSQRARNARVTEALDMLERINPLAA